MKRADVSLDVALSTLRRFCIAALAQAGLDEMKMKPVIIAMLTAVLTSGSLHAQAVSPGTYRIKLCDRPCAARTAREIGTGVLVLFADSAGYADAERSSAVTLPRPVFRLSATAAPNGCFAASVPERKVGGRELYFGIIPRSATRWTAARDSTSVLIYTSPDARYSLQWAARDVTKEGFTGIGVQLDCCSELHGQFGVFVAQRTGEPDLRACG
jgi:hypothetical protein